VRINALLKTFRTLPAGSRRVAIAQVTMLRSLSIAVNVCTGLLTAALLGPQGRGELAALLVAPQLLAGLSTLGLHGSLIYNVKADPEHEREYITINLLLTFCAGLVAMAVGWLLEPIWLAKYDSNIVELGRAFLFVTPLISASSTFTAVLEARGRFVAANQSQYLQSLCTLIVLGILVLLKHLTPATAAAAYLWPAALAFIYLGLLVGYRSASAVRLRSQQVGRLLHYGVRIYGDDVLATVSPYLDQIVIAAMLPPAALGVYVVGLSLSRLLNVLPASATTVLFPSLAARPTVAISETVAAAVRVLGTINAATAVCIGLLGPHLLSLLYGAKFAAASGPLSILLIAGVCSNVVQLLFQLYVGSGRPGMVTIIQTLGFGVSLGSMLLLVPAYGTVGAALALLLAALARLALVLLGMPLTLGVRVPRLVPSLSDLAWMKGR
jgi:O-antigen/teichoic acid export membrane protein